MKTFRRDGSKTPKARKLRKQDLGANEGKYGDQARPFREDEVDYNDGTKQVPRKKPSFTPGESQHG